jgi:hypothetical protein
MELLDNCIRMHSNIEEGRVMDALIIKSLEEFVDKANMILNNSITSAYCFGSSIYEDFYSGYSDFDFFIVTENDITEHNFEEFSLLGTELKNLKRQHFSFFL